MSSIKQAQIGWLQLIDRTDDADEPDTGFARLYAKQAEIYAITSHGLVVPVTTSWLFADYTNLRVGYNNVEPTHDIDHIITGMRLKAPGGGNVSLYLDREAGKSAEFQFTTAGVVRWRLAANNTAEGGSDAGSDLVFQAWNDAGNTAITWLQVTRSTGFAKMLRLGLRSGVYGTGAGDGVIAIGNAASVPTAGGTNTAQLYAQTGELKVMDSSGNVTQLSSHEPSQIDTSNRPTTWAHIETSKEGHKIEVDLFRVAQLLEALTGEKLIYIDEGVSHE